MSIEQTGQPSSSGTSPSIPSDPTASGGPRQIPEKSTAAYWKWADNEVLNGRWPEGLERPEVHTKSIWTIDEIFPTGEPPRADELGRQLQAEEHE